MTNNPEFHRHEPPKSMTRMEIETKLKTFTLIQLHQIAKADGVPVLDNLERQYQAILYHWFPENLLPDGREPDFQDLIRMADQLPPGERKVWKKKTHGKELGF